MSRFGVITRNGIVRSFIEGSQANLYDPDAQAFFTAASITDNTQKSAVNQLVLDLKAASIWTKMKALYPIVGGVASAHAVNLKQPGTYNLSFATGWTHSSTGMTPNGATYADTFLIPSTTLTLNSSAIGYYGGNNITPSVNKCAIGSVMTGQLLSIEPTYPAYGLFGDVNDGSATFTANTISSGFIFASRTSSSEKIHSIRGVQTIKTENSIGTPTVSVVIGARNNNGNLENYSLFQHRFDFISDGLTSTEASNLYTAVQNFQTTLGRQV